MASVPPPGSAAPPADTVLQVQCGSCSTIVNGERVSAVRPPPPLPPPPAANPPAERFFERERRILTPFLAHVAVPAGFLEPLLQAKVYSCPHCSDRQAITLTPQLESDCRARALKALQAVAAAKAAAAASVQQQLPQMQRMAQLLAANGGGGAARTQLNQAGVTPLQVQLAALQNFAMQQQRQQQAASAAAGGTGAAAGGAPRPLNNAGLAAMQQLQQQQRLELEQLQRQQLQQQQQMLKQLQAQQQQQQVCEARGGAGMGWVLADHC